MDTDDARRAAAELSPAPVSQANDGHRCLMLAARSTGIARLLYMVRNRITAQAKANLSGSQHYEKDIRTGSHATHYRVAFFQRSAQRTFFYQNGSVAVSAPVSILPLPTPCYDPLTVLYALRLKNPAPGKTYSERITDGKTSNFMQVDIRGPERTRVDAGEFETLRADIRLNGVNGVFRTGPKGRFTVWITRTFPHTPVKVQSRVRIGPFTGMLKAELLRSNTLPHLQ